MLKLKTHSGFHDLFLKYWSIDGEYRIYLRKLRNGEKDEL